MDHQPVFPAWHHLNYIYGLSFIHQKGKQSFGNLRPTLRSSMGFTWTNKH